MEIIEQSFFVKIVKHFVIVISYHLYAVSASMLDIIIGIGS